MCSLLTLLSSLAFEPVEVENKLMLVVLDGLGSSKFDLALVDTPLLCVCVSPSCLAFVGDSLLVVVNSKFLGLREDILGCSVLLRVSGLSSNA